MSPARTLHHIQQVINALRRTTEAYLKDDRVLQGLCLLSIEQALRMFVKEVEEEEAKKCQPSD
jgi:hypothetical protein